MGFDVIDADAEAKKLYSMPEIRQYVLNNLGSDTYCEEKANYKVIASKIFGNDNKYTCLTEFLKPHLERALSALILESNQKIIILEAAMLFEYGLEKICDDVICVVADTDARIERVMVRDKCSREAVESRERYQWPQEKKVKRSAIIIRNNDDDAVIPQVNKLITEDKRFSI